MISTWDSQFWNHNQSKKVQSKASTDSHSVAETETADARMEHGAVCGCLTEVDMISTMN